MNAGAFDRRQVARAFGAVLKNARSQQGLSQEALCEGADMDRTYPSLLERGLRTPTSGQRATVLVSRKPGLRSAPA
jgi:ribosome-binding protein aMBF1 (putative translation factor)